MRIRKQVDVLPLAGGRGGGGGFGGAGVEERVDGGGAEARAESVLNLRRGGGRGRVRVDPAIRPIPMMKPVRCAGWYFV